MKKILTIIITLFIFVLCDNAYALEEGNYIIQSKLNENKVIDLSNGRIGLSTNIQLYDRNDSPAQIWTVTSSNDGYYYIKSYKDSNYSLDINNGKYYSGNNVQLYSLNYSNAQKWKLVDNGDGYFSIKAYNENYSIDVNNGSTANGTNIQIYSSNGSNAQKFKFTEVEQQQGGTPQDEPQQPEPQQQTLEEGKYIIRSKLNDNKAIDINNGIMALSTNIQLYDKNDSPAQIWEVVKSNDGYYYIKSTKNNNYCLDINNGQYYSGNNVQLYSVNYSNAQKWKIVDNGDGTYSIKSYNNNYSIDVNNGSTANGANIQIYLTNSSNAQKFIFTKAFEGSQTVSDGYYIINSKLNLLKSLDINNGTMKNNQNVQIYDFNGSLAQKWYVKYNGDGYYSIMSNKDSNFSLAYENSQIGNVKIETKDSTKESQKWIIKDNKNGYYSIINKNGSAIDVNNGSTANGNNIQVYPVNYSNAQQFRFQTTANGLSDNTSVNGYYFIKSAINENYVLDVDNGKTYNGTNIQLYEKNSSKAQKWNVTNLNNGYYKITTGLNFGKTLDVAGGNSKPKTNIQLYTYDGSIAQQWLLKDAGDGYYYIVSNCNGLYLEVDGTAANGVNIETNTFTGNMNQKFKLEKTRLENLVIDVSSHNGDVDWDKVKNEAGLYGVIVRVSAGSANIDKKLKRNTDELKRLSIPYGLYIYSYAEDQYGTVSDLGYAHEAELEAKRVLKAITDYNLNPTLGIYYDLEVWDKSNPANKYWTSNEFAPLINYFGTTMTNAGYSNWRIYTNLSLANGSLSPWKDRITWIAQWNTSCSYDSYYNLWQYTSSGIIPGISGNVDLNTYYID